jgi:transcriptional regulator with XRE-family HTH domain
MSNMEIQFVLVGDLSELNIEFDVVVDAEIELCEGDYHYDDYDINNKWVTVKCLADFACDLEDFRIIGIEVYQKSKMSKPLSDALVPFIYKKDLELEAQEFLQKYYPVNLKTAKFLDPIELAETMGLSVEMREITEDMSIFGQIYFQDAEVEFYDAKQGELIKTIVKAKTIVVDPNIFFLRNLGAVNNTIVHECVHWDKHRKAFELERLYNENAIQIKCKVVGGIKGNKRNAVDWMEWHANALAPKIQMPLIPFKIKAHEFIKRFQKEIGSSEFIDIMESTIRALADFFCVSNLAAKIRMIEAGYEEAIGTFTYIDNRYVKPHRFKKGTLERNQTFSIDAVDATIQSITHPEIKNGSYLYIDSHFVLNHPKYVTVNLFGETVLTRYTLTHMDECCLVFDLTVESGGGERYFTECFLNREKDSKIKFTVGYNHGYQHATVEKQAALLKSILKEEAEVYGKLTTDFRYCLSLVKEWRNITYEELGQMISMDESAARRIINGQTDGSINSLILICLALGLPPKISKHIIDHSPHSFIAGNESHILYEFALTHLYPQPMKEIFNFLNANGADPL